MKIAHSQQEKMRFPDPTGEVGSHETYAYLHRNAYLNPLDVFLYISYPWFPLFCWDILEDLPLSDL